MKAKQIIFHAEGTYIHRFCMSEHVVIEIPHNNHVGALHQEVTQFLLH